MVFIQGLPSMKSRSKWAVDSPSLTWWQTCGATGVITIKSFQHLPTSVKRRFGHKWLLGPGPPLTPWLWYSNIVCHSDLHLSFKARSGYAKHPAAAVDPKPWFFLKLPASLRTCAVHTWMQIQRKHTNIEMTTWHQGFKMRPQEHSGTHKMVAQGTIFWPSFLHKWI